MLWQRGIKKVLQPFDLTHPQFVLLASAQWFSQQGKEITQVSLANFTKIDPMTTSQVVRTLQSKDLITREEHKTDTHAKVVSIVTPKILSGSSFVSAVSFGLLFA